MANLQTMPSGWDCRFDERSGKYYYINHYTKTTTWEDPRARFRGAAKNVQTEHVPLQDIRSRMSPLTVKSSKVQDSSLTALTDTDEAVAKISVMFPTVSETHIRLLLKNCRYMKSVFPEADETVILEILQNNDQNIQKVSDILKDMGYHKKDTVKMAQQKMEAKKLEEIKKDQDETEKPPSPQLKIKSTDEKEQIKTSLQEKYKDVPEHLISIALESVNFDENRANQILQIMIQEDNEAADNKIKQEQHHLEPNSNSAPITPQPINIPISQSRQSLKSLLKEKSDKEKSTFVRVIEEHDTNIQSKNLINTRGQNPSYAKGPNEKLLLEDYVKWQGANAGFKKGPQSLAKGPNIHLLSGRSYQAQGPNMELRKGPKLGLAKGSIFSQLKTSIIGESRGK